MKTLLLVVIGFLAATNITPALAGGTAAARPTPAAGHAVSVQPSAVPLRPLASSEISFLKKVASAKGSLSLDEAAWAYGTGSMKSGPGQHGYIAHHGSGSPKDITISITEAGAAFLRTLRAK